MKKLWAKLRARWECMRLGHVDVVDWEPATDELEIPKFTCSHCGHTWRGIVTRLRPRDPALLRPAMVACWNCHGVGASGEDRSPCVTCLGSGVLVGNAK